MKKGEYVFVYGTLRRGQRADLQKSGHDFGAVFVGEDKIGGQLYHLGSYPGAKKPCDFDEAPSHITGEVFRVVGAELASVLDTYEGYDADQPTKGLYNRCQVVTQKGRTVWVYVYNDRVTTDQLIESGDWCRNPDTPIRNRVLAR